MKKVMINSVVKNILKRAANQALGTRKPRLARRERCPVEEQAGMMLQAELVTRVRMLCVRVLLLYVSIII